MIQIDKNLIDELIAKAMCSEEKCECLVLSDETEDGGLRVLSAMAPGCKVSVQRNPGSTESIMCVTGDVDVAVYEGTDGAVHEDENFPRSMWSLPKVVQKELRVKEHVHLCPDLMTYGCVIPSDTWFAIEPLQPSVILESKDRKDGTEVWG